METRYYQKHLLITQNKIQTLEAKKENCARWQFEQILDEIRVLKEIEQFLWNKL